MKRTWRFLAAGLSVYLLVLLVTFPAERASRFLERRLPGLDMRAVSGTVFTGQAAQLAIKDLALGPLNWSLNPAALLLGRLEYRVEIRDPAMRGTGRLGLGLTGVPYARDIAVELRPDVWVNHFSPLPVHTGGMVTLLLESVEPVNHFPRELKGSLAWADANILEPVELSLGQVDAVLGSAEDGLVCRITGSGGTALSGDLSLAPGGAYSLNLLVTPDAETPLEMVDMLKSVGQPRAGGAYLITDTGQL